MPSLMVAAFRRLVAGVFLATLGACAAPPKPFPLAGGQTGYAVRCGDRLERCYERALQACPAGYTVIDSRSSSYVEPVFVGQYRGVNQYATAGGTEHTLAIKCR